LTHLVCLCWVDFMSRPLRIEYPNAWYHAMNRGRRGENIFHDKQDYQMFIPRFFLKDTYQRTAVV
jgi:hypothetical protein